MITINTSKGDISIKLHDDVAPKTAANFLEYVRDGFYENTVFHRVIKGFMIQGGGLTASLENKKTNAPVVNESHTDNPNKRGTIAMARTAAPDSATAQFFINLVDNAFLNKRGDSPDACGYCVFAEVVEGMDIVDAIATVKTGSRMGHDDVPLEEITINKITETSEAQ